MIKNHEIPPPLNSAVSSAVSRAAFLWMDLRGEGLPSMLVTTFAEAAGLDGRQNGGLSSRAAHVC